MSRSSSKKRGTPARAILANGINGRALEAAERNLRPLSTCPLGTLIEIVERASYGGTQAPEWLELGTRAVVCAHVGDPVESVLVHLEGAGPRARVPYLAPHITVRVLRERDQSSVPGREVDPLRGVA